MEAGMTRNSVVLFAGAAALAGLLAGCRVEKTTHGDSKDVDISTPFGGLKVKTNQPDVLAEIGLPAYPGAIAFKNDDANKDTSADVNMNFGNFHLRVRAADYRTGDSPDKVQAFYLDAMKRRGDVIVCRNSQPVGQPDHTSEGLTCDTHEGAHVTVEDNRGTHQLELRSGSKEHQRIVSITPDAGGARFGLVVLDLPGHFGGGDDGGDDTRQ
jgi:hypothetical protein